MPNFKKNINYKYNPVTIIIAIILWIVALALFLFPYFLELKKEVNNYLPLGLAIAGVLFYFSPDTIIGIVKKKAENFTNKEE